MEYEFKFIKLPEEHGFDEQHLKFLQALDEGMVKSKEGMTEQKDLEQIKSDWDKSLNEIRSSFDYEKLQKQINDVYVKIADRPAYSEKQLAEKERDLNSQWIRKLIKKDEEGMKKIGLELKQSLTPVMHTGEGSSVLDYDMTQGGYLIPKLLLAEVNRWVDEAGIARRDMRYLPFSGAGNQRYIPTLLTNVTVQWIDEGEAKPKTKPYISRVEQTLKKLAAMVIFTEEIIEDSAVDLVALSSQLIGEAIAVEEDAQFLGGIGAPWLGALNVGVPVPMGAGLTAENLRPEHLEALTFSVPKAARAGGKFYMHPEIYGLLRTYRSSAVAAGDREGVYLVQDPTGTRPASLWGYPIVETEALPTFLEAQVAEAPVLFFSNLQRTCVYGDKQGVRVKLLDQASVYDANNTLVNLAEQDMIALRIHKRVGFVPVLPDGIATLYTGPVS